MGAVVLLWLSSRFWSGLLHGVCVFLMVVCSFVAVCVDVVMVGEIVVGMVLVVEEDVLTASVLPSPSLLNYSTSTPPLK